MKKADATISRYFRQNRKPRALVSALVDIGEDPVPSLCEFLRCGRRRDFRAFAARVLGHIGDIRATPWLVAALHDTALIVQQAAAEALGKLPVLNLPNADEVIAALGMKLRSHRLDVASTAAETLGRIGGCEAVECLATVLLENSPSRDAVARAQRLAKAFVDLVGGPVPQPPSATPEARLAIVDALAAIGEPALSILIHLLGDDDPAVQERAASRLTAIGQAGMDALVAALQDDAAEVRVLAARALATSDWQATKLKDQVLLGLVLEGERGFGVSGDAVTLLLCEMLAEPARWLRCAAARALGRSGDREALPALRMRLQRLVEFDGKVREAISAAIQQIEAATGATAGLPRSLSHTPDPAARPREGDNTPDR